MIFGTIDDGNRSSSLEPRVSQQEGEREREEDGNCKGNKNHF
jgi:hypothetical protein